MVLEPYFRHIISRRRYWIENLASMTESNLIVDKAISHIFMEQDLHYDQNIVKVPFY